MNNIIKRYLLFLIGCMGSRFGLTFFINKYPQVLLPYLAIPSLIIAIGFSIIYIMGWRKTGAEVFGDKIWWNDLRPIHAKLWFIISIFAFNQDKNTWIFLLLDTIIGLESFILFHLRNLNV